MMSKTLRGTLVVSVLMLSTGFILGMYATPTTDTTNMSAIPNAETQTPVDFRPSSFPLAGKSTTLDEAQRLANVAGFAIRFPTRIPSGLQLTDIRTSGMSPVSPEKQSIQIVGEVYLVYSNEPLRKGSDLPDLLDSGGMLTIEQKRVPGSFEQYLQQELQGEDQRGLAKAVTINGNPGIYGGGSLTTLMWVDGGSQLEIVASSEYFTINDLIAIAETFAEITAITTFTTTDTVTVTEATQIITTMTDTTTVSALTTLTLTVTEEVTKIMTEVTKPLIYAWAIGATAIAAVLAVVLRKKS